MALASFISYLCAKISKFLLKIRGKSQALYKNTLFLIFHLTLYSLLKLLTKYTFFC